MTESDTKLPSFSFTKKPVSQYSSFQPSRSHISDVLLSTSSSSPFNQKRTITPENKSNSDIFNEVDYNEQIRAPRMSTVSYTTQVRRKDTDDSLASRKDFNTSSSSIDADLLEVETKASSNEDGKYEPAKFDLSKPTRRFSVPEDNKKDDPSTILDYTNDNYIYQKSNDGNIRLTPVTNTIKNNLYNNESQFRVKNGLINSHVQDLGRSASVKQVYAQKKPLCVPAVLRPEISDIPEEEGDQLKSETLQEATNNISIPNHETLTSLKSSRDITKVHWMPNDSTDHCMRCFKDFCSLFNPMKSRKHHCRYCGFLYCSDCLMDGTFSMVLLDKDARFVIPIFENLGDVNFHDSFARNFKIDKICKGCSEKHSSITNLLNLKNLKLPYLFVENPYIVKFKKGLSSSRTCLKKPQTDIANDYTIIMDSNNRKASIDNVLTDWVWSSF